MLSPETARLKQVLDAIPGAVGEPMTASRGKEPLVLLYKVMGKMFAILSVRGESGVILKLDQGLIEALREEYASTGHRTHLDSRYWIAIGLTGDVPMAEVERLAQMSFDLVASKLTKAQKAELEAKITARLAAD